MNSVLSRSTPPWLAVAIAWGLAFSLVCRISTHLPMTDSDEGIIGQLFGESRSALSANLYERADTFFHRGVMHVEHRALTNDWIQAWRNEITPLRHLHTEGNATAEIIPWLKLATKADPHNVEASLVLSFWVSTGLNRPDLAHRILLDAQRLNPTDYKIPLEMARIAIRHGDFVLAQTKLSVALARWPSRLDPADKEALLDKAEAHTLLGFICEIEEHAEQAVSHFKNTLAIFPERSYIRSRAAQLESGNIPPDSARDRLMVLVRRSIDDACKDEHDEHPR